MSTDANLNLNDNEADKKIQQIQALGSETETSNVTSVASFETLCDTNVVSNEDLTDSVIPAKCNPIRSENCDIGEGTKTESVGKETKFLAASNLCETEVGHPDKCQEDKTDRSEEGMIDDPQDTVQRGISEEGVDDRQEEFIEKDLKAEQRQGLETFQRSQEGDLKFESGNAELGKRLDENIDIDDLQPEEKIENSERHSHAVISNATTTRLDAYSNIHNIEQGTTTEENIEVDDSDQNGNKFDNNYPGREHVNYQDEDFHSDLDADSVEMKSIPELLDDGQHIKKDFTHLSESNKSMGNSFSCGSCDTGDKDDLGQEKRSPNYTEIQRKNFNSDGSDEDFMQETSFIRKKDKQPRVPVRKPASRFSRYSDHDLENYRQGYPHKKDNARLNDNWLFYSGQIESQPRGAKIDVILKEWWGNYDRLESHHGYIQWLFPIPESGMNMHAQELQKHEAEKIRDDSKASKRFLKAYKMMLDFYGLQLKDEKNGTLTRAANWKTRFKHLNFSTHNYLRITRILKCLGEMGLEHYKPPFLRMMLKEAIVEKTLNRTLESCWNYWIGTLRNDADRKKIEDYAEWLERGTYPPQDDDDELRDEDYLDKDDDDEGMGRKQAKKIKDTKKKKQETTKELRGGESQDYSDDDEQGMERKPVEKMRDTKKKKQERKTTSIQESKQKQHPSSVDDTKINSQTFPEENRKDEEGTEKAEAEKYVADMDL